MGKRKLKYFGLSYTSYTLPTNALEIEFWHTGRIDKGIGSYFRWQPRVEIEYEPKILLSKRFDNFVLVLNINFEFSSHEKYELRTILGIEL